MADIPQMETILGKRVAYGGRTWLVQIATVKELQTGIKITFMLTPAAGPTPTEHAPKRFDFDLDNDRCQVDGEYWPCATKSMSDRFTDEQVQVVAGILSRQQTKAEGTVISDTTEDAREILAAVAAGPTPTEET